MAENLMEFMNELEKTKPAEFTAPQVRYGAEEDALTFYFRGEESYAHRLNKLVTLFLAFDSHELVGCQVKGIRRRLANDGDFGVRIMRGGDVELGLYFHLLAYETPESEPRNRLVELAQRAKGVRLNAENLELIAC